MGGRERFKANLHRRLWRGTRRRVSGIAGHNAAMAALKVWRIWRRIYLVIKALRRITAFVAFLAVAFKGVLLLFVLGREQDEAQAVWNDDEDREEELEEAF